MRQNPKKREEKPVESGSLDDDSQRTSLRVSVSTTLGEARPRPSEEGAEEEHKSDHDATLD